MNMSRTNRSEANAKAMEALISQINQDTHADLVDEAATLVKDGQTPEDAVDMMREWAISEALGNLTESASGPHSSRRIVEGIRARCMAEAVKEMGHKHFKKVWIKDVERAATPDYMKD